MSRRLTIIIIILCCFLVLASLLGLIWANARFARDHPGEKAFLVPWLAARTFLQFGNNPYSDPATQRAEIVYYGRLSNPGEDPLRLDVPFPLELFYFPFALIPDYALARGLWMTLLELALVALGVVSISLANWKPSKYLVPIILLIAVFWIYGFLPLLANQSAIYLGLAIAGVLLSIREEKDELAGVLLIFPLARLDIGGLFLILVFVWSIYHRRWRILAGLGMAMLLLLALGFFLLPDWFLPFVRGLLSHFIYDPGFSPGRIFASWWPVAGPRLGWILTFILGFILLLEWRSARKKEYPHLLWTASLTLAITFLIGVPVHVQDEVILFVPLLLFIMFLGRRWSRSRRSYVPLIILAITWVIFTFLAVILFLQTPQAVVNDVLILVFPAILIAGLYWMRWWAVQAPHVGSENLT